MTNPLDEYNEIEARERAAIEEAWAIFDEETAEARAVLERAEEAYDAVAQPARWRAKEREREARERRDAEWQELWDAEMDRQREHYQFIVDLLSQPSEEAMVALLRTEIAKTSSD